MVRLWHDLAVTVEQDDFALLEAWRGGDSAAGNQLFERHFEVVYRFFHKKVSGAPEDLVQQTFLTCVEARDRFRGGSKFRTYLLSIARFELMSYLRKKYNQPIDFTTTSFHDLGASASTALAVERDRRALYDALESLPLDLQIALELAYWEELPTTEIAVVLGVPTTTVHSWLRRAKRQLRAHLDKLERGRPA